jgi:hypothetical protein
MKLEMSSKLCHYENYDFGPFFISSSLCVALCVGYNNKSHVDEGYKSRL